MSQLREEDGMAFTPSDDPDDPYKIPTTLRMSERDFKQFLEALEKNEEPSEGLREAAARFKAKYGDK